MPYFRIILNALIMLLLVPGLATPNRIEINQTVESFEEELDAYAQMQQGLPITYDGFLKLLHDIENDELEKRYGLEDLEQINHFLIACARKGLLPSDDAEELEADIEELLSDDSEFSFWTDTSYSIVPITFYGPFQPMLCKSAAAKAWKSTKKWVKKHKKPIIIAAAVIVAAAVTLGIAAAASGAAAAGAAAAASSGSNDTSKESEEPKPIPFPSEGSSSESSAVGSALDGEIASFKQIIDREEVLNARDVGLSVEETERILKDVFACQTYDAFQKMANTNPQFSNELRQSGLSKNSGPIEIVFSSDGSKYSVRNPNLGVEENFYQLRGERFLQLESYDQAIHDFRKSIELNPNSHEGYLNRATAYLRSGNYTNSLADYQKYISLKPAPLEYAAHFSSGFVSGFSKGVMESGVQLGSFAKDVIIHPINTAMEVGEGLAGLSKLVCSKEWGSLGETLVPEVYEVVEKWDTLSPTEQGDHAGYIFGKYGADVFLPGASAKVISKGVTGAKDLVTACKSLKTAEKVLAIEALAEGALSESIGFESIATRESIKRVLAEKGIMTDKTVRAIEEFLGGQGRVITNADGDLILMRGNKKIRFDIKDPHGDNPHFHLEKKNPNGEWVDAGPEHRYYFTEE